jgi:hypothetical protein
MAKTLTVSEIFNKVKKFRDCAEDMSSSYSKKTPKDIENGADYQKKCIVLKFELDAIQPAIVDPYKTMYKNALVHYLKFRK